jgi:hypothetical protein
MHGVPLGEGIVPLPQIADLLRAHAPECSIWLESLIVPGDSPAGTWAAEQQAVASGIRYARETLGL